MIPTYRDFTHLDATLASVTAVLDELDWTPQITVVDDGSPTAPGRIVDRYASAGVQLVEGGGQRGAIGNFNRCLDLATGRYVHLLHSDDVVYRGFYSRAAAALERPDIGAYACRCAHIDALGTPFGASRNVRATPGVWATARADLAWRNSLRFPGVALRSDVIDRVGRYDEVLPHTADWHYWARVAQESMWWWDPRVGAGYRLHDASDTSRLRLDGSNNAERRRCIELIHADPARSGGPGAWAQANTYSAALAVRDAATLVRTGEFHGARAQLVEAGRSLWSARRRPA